MMIDIAGEVLRSYGGISVSCALADVNIRKDYTLDPFLEHLVGKLNISKENLKNHPRIRALRDFYWRIGIDPTKVRPASEALVRRFLMNHTIPKINNVVDARNIASIETLVPIGIYDAEVIVESIVLRLANSNEGFIDIFGHRHLLEGKEVVLSDRKDIMHVFPYRDSLWTKVMDHTKRVLVVGCDVPGIEPEQAKLAVDTTFDLVKILSTRF